MKRRSRKTLLLAALVAGIATVPFIQRHYAADEKSANAEAALSDGVAFTLKPDLQEALGIATAKIEMREVGGAKDPVIALPRSSVLVEDDGKSYVFARLENDDQKFQRWEVTTGKAKDKKFIEARAGVFPGDVLAVEGVDLIAKLEGAALPGSGNVTTTAATPDSAVKAYLGDDPGIASGKDAARTQAPKVAKKTKSADKAPLAKSPEKKKSQVKAGNSNRPAPELAKATTGKGTVAKGDDEDDDSIYGFQGDKITERRGKDRRAASTSTHTATRRSKRSSRYGDPFVCPFEERRRGTVEDCPRASDDDCPRVSGDGDECPLPYRGPSSYYSEDFSYYSGYRFGSGEPCPHGRD